MKEKFRLTIDMPANDHMHLKAVCTKLSISMREFLLQAAFEKIEAIEDEWLALRRGQINPLGRMQKAFVN